MIFFPYKIITRSVSDMAEMYNWGGGNFAVYENKNSSFLFL